jgi:hypothetical protein
MGGFNDSPNIWQPTKDYLGKTLKNEAKGNSNSRVTILPFQEKVLKPIKVDLNNINWAHIESVLDGYLNKVTATNICDSWLEAEKYVDPSCDNYIYLLTDGHDNIGGTVNEPKRIEKLAQILESFCGKANTNGCYVELTKQAILPDKIREVIENCHNLSRVDASKGIQPFGGTADGNININTNELPVDIPIGFSNPDLFSAEIPDSGNEFINISVKDNKISHGQIIIHVESKFGDNIETLNKAIGGQRADIPFRVNSNEVIITNPDLNITLHTTPLRTLEIASKDTNLSSTIKRVKPFLWIKAHQEDTLRWVLNPIYNQAAKEDNGVAMFCLKSDKDLSNYTILYDGNELSSDSTIVIQPTSNAIIEVIIPQTEKDEEINLSLREVSSHNLDRINNERPRNATIQLNGVVTTSMSLIEIIFWSLIALIVIFLILWFTIIRNQKYPKFNRGIINIQSPYYASIKVRGSRMVILGPRVKTQSWFDKVWKGKIVYHTNPIWPCEIEVRPSGKHMRFRCPSNQLISDPNPIWTIGNNYKILNSSDNSFKIDININ